MMNCREVAGLGQYCDISAVLAVSSVLGIPVQTFWPPLRGLCLQDPLTQLVVGHDVQSHTKAITIMWSTCGSVRSTGPVDINHFVPFAAQKCVT